MKKSKSQMAASLLLLVIILLYGSASQGAETTGALGSLEKPVLGKSKSLPAFELPMPQGKADKRYLGLSGTGNFKIGQIKAPVLIIEVFSFYCPHCQRSAAQVNELYQKIAGRPDIKEKIKMIGIGVGNSLYEVNSFRERYEVPFPLISDQSMEITEMLGVKGTPTFIVVKVDGKGFQEQVYFGEGGFKDTQQFLAEIIKLSGLEAEVIK